MFDCHLHTIFSTDSKMKIEEAINKSKETGLGIIVTEHMDLKYPTQRDFIFDVEEYFSKYEDFRGEELLLGMEMGMRTDCVEENYLLNEKHNFDYIIGSVHLVNGVDIYQKSYYQGRNKKEAYGEYFEYMLQCINNYDFVDSLGHIDYIARYATFDNNELYYSEFDEVIDEILSQVINKNIVMEINTRRLGNKETFSNMLEIFNRYKQLGGEFVTLGSDAHVADNIGSNFSIGREIAELCSLKPVHFKERKMIVSE